MGYHFREQESYVRILELTPELRKEIESTIEKLIALLDRWDGDENLEETGDEHDTGMPEGWRGTSIYFEPDFRQTILEDDEESDPGEDDGCTEPDLGWSSTGAHGDQWANNNGAELDECDLEEGDTGIGDLDAFELMGGIPNGWFPPEGKRA